MIPRVQARFFPVLDGFGRTPLQACETLFAAPVPGGFSFVHRYVARGADTLADRAAGARVVNMKGAVHFRDMRKADGVDPRVKDPLP